MTETSHLIETRTEQREGHPVTHRGACSCGWMSSGYTNEASVEQLKNVHQRVAAARDARAMGESR